MPYRICKTFEIENGHLLSKHPDVCRFPHGHSRTVEFVIEAGALDANDMVCDFKVLGEVMRDFLSSWDHALAMNTRDPAFAEMRARYGERIIPFEATDPTTEVMAKTIFDECSSRLAAYAARGEVRYPLSTHARLASVRVWETRSSWAEFCA